ncbi:hypothetical protein [Virgisporangium aurantiacum]|uniref:Uncharacterized protein n=1 Tax=Virgisporangium aurantiacum TaxID=175570 RepID=A0A8J3Z1U7_9ACTN|nr:hypothetical protein [Virgisporangium aurantiacum]GIJ55891.1 hypothetical protein Vau01_034070 [Virgisporangium aurantiacum]
MTDGDSPVPAPARRPWLATLEPLGASEQLESAGRLQVDGQDLKVIGQYLNELAASTRAIRREAAAGDVAATASRERYRSLGSDDIGPVMDMRAAFAGAAQQLDTDLDNLTKAIAHTAAAMEKLAKQYRDADERNKLDAATVRRYLG